MAEVAEKPIESCSSAMYFEEQAKLYQKKVSAVPPASNLKDAGIPDNLRLLNSQIIADLIHWGTFRPNQRKKKLEDILNGVYPLNAAEIPEIIIEIIRREFYHPRGRSELGLMATTALFSLKKETAEPE